MRNVHLKSQHHIRFENGEMTENSPVQVRRDVYAVKDEESPTIYHVYIKDPETGNYLMEPKAMKIVKDEMMRITLEGITLNDPDNKWGFDFSDLWYSIYRKCYDRNDWAIWDCKFITERQEYFNNLPINK